MVSLSIIILFFENVKNYAFRNQLKDSNTQSLDQKNPRLWVPDLQSLNPMRKRHLFGQIIKHNLAQNYKKSFIPVTLSTDKK